MELEHTFTVPLGVDDAFRVLRDIERIGPCMPGATIDSVDGDTFTGRVKVKVGPMQVTYQGTAAFTDVDEAAHSAVIEAKARETRGAGTANATIRASCAAGGDGTEVHVVTDLAVTGKPAQFGRGVMADVGEKLLGRFADCLAEELSGEPEPTPEPGPEPAVPGGPTGLQAPAAPVAAAGGPVGGDGEGAGGGPAAAGMAGAPAERRTDDTIDLLGVAGGPVARRVAPAALVLALVALLVWLARRR